MVANVSAYLDNDPWTLWWQGLLAAVVVLTAAAIVFPQAVYEGFIWKYFWGPVVADGLGYNCVAYAGGAEIPCHEAGAGMGPEATPGYTTISTVSYAVVLLAFIIGVYLGLERFNIEPTHKLFFALIPFVFLGGTMRVLEDTALLAQATATDGLVLEFPLTAMLISPLIYFLVFFIAVGTLAAAVYLDRRGKVTTYEHLVAGVGVVILVIALGYFLYLISLIPEESTLSVPLFVITLVGATAATAVVWVAAVRWIPSINAGTGLIGPVLIWGHAVDGFANVLSLDWNEELGLGRSYDTKHVVNEAVADITEMIQPAAVSDMIGTVWPFIPLKIGVALLVVYLFNDELYEDSPSFFMLLLIAVLAVGLGPGTRDLLRATFGV